MHFVPFLFSERLKMDNTVTQDDDDGGKITLQCQLL